MNDVKPNDRSIMGYEREIKELRELLQTKGVETPATITAWADATFGPITSTARAWERVKEEWKELSEAMDSHLDQNQAGADSGAGVAKEAADVTICLSRLLLSAFALDLQAVVDVKMQINRGREWNLDGTGHGYHKKKPYTKPEIKPK